MTTDRLPAYRAIADSIRADILARRLVPGDRLPVETDLAGRFGVGRSTIREALRDLASQNLVETTRGATGGTFVVVPNTETLARSLSVGIEVLAGSTDLNVAEMLEARELLEIPATRLAAVRATPEQTDSIADHIESRRRGEAEGRELVANWNFHTLVVRAANNPLLGLMSEPIFHVLQTRFGRIRPSSGFRQRVEADHRVIAAALIGHDADRAAAAMLEHLEYLRPFYKEFDTRLGRT
ncbi:MAG TPA: FadR/GntR family transcriptional regulator [Acidimicrobiia bacterium]|nr:FadR/GntR family transcriptional regulator [Acidimicrobiia bacterium]